MIILDESKCSSQVRSERIIYSRIHAGIGLGLWIARNNNRHVLRADDVLEYIFIG